MPLTVVELQADTDAAAARATWISVHSADPSTTGANEATGGSPAYARKQTTWGAANGSGIATGSQVSIDVPAMTVAWVGFWSASTAGTFRGSINVTDEVYAAQGIYQFTPTFDGDTT